MRAVWKFKLAIRDRQTVPMPDFAELLHVDEQGGILCLWARLDPDAGEVERTILIRGTGHPTGNEPYVGTVITRGGLLVWHVFDGGVEDHH